MRLRGALSCGFSPHSRKPKRTASTASAIVTMPRISCGLTSRGCMDALGRKVLMVDSYWQWRDGALEIPNPITPLLHHTNISFLLDRRRDLRARDQLVAPAFNIRKPIVDDHVVPFAPGVERNESDVGQRVVANKIFFPGHFLVQCIQVLRHFCLSLIRLPVMRQIG